MGSGEALAHTSPTQSSFSSCLLYFFSLPNSPVRERGQARFLSQSRCEVWDCSSRRAGLYHPVPKPSRAVALMSQHTVSSKWQGGTRVQHISLAILGGPSLLRALI